MFRTLYVTAGFLSISANYAYRDICAPCTEQLHWLHFDKVPYSIRALYLAHPRSVSKTYQNQRARLRGSIRHWSINLFVPVDGHYHPYSIEIVWVLAHWVWCSRGRSIVALSIVCSSLCEWVMMDLIFAQHAKETSTSSKHSGQSTLVIPPLLVAGSSGHWFCVLPELCCTIANNPHA